MQFNLEQALGAWYPLLSQEFSKQYMIDIGYQLQQDVKKLQPKFDNVFRALQLCPPEKVKVVIIGQDPYPGGQADGLAFSSGDGTLPYSLQIIFNELTNSGLGTRTKTSLEDWAEQGVLLLNVHLTTLRSHMNAHSEIGWDEFTGKILHFCANKPGTIFLAWGGPAKASAHKYVVGGFNVAKRIVLYHSHPRAHNYGYPFIGCGHFVNANRILMEQKRAPINWTNEPSKP